MVEALLPRSPPTTEGGIMSFPQNPNKPIQRVHCDIWPDTQFILRKIAPVNPARPEPAGFGAGDVPEIRRYEANGPLGHAQALRNQAIHAGARLVDLHF